MGVIAALSAEAKCFAHHPIPIDQITTINTNLILVSGMGAKNAATASRRLVEHGATALVSWGTAGGLCDQLRPGDIVLPESVFNDDRSEFIQTDSLWRENLQQTLASHLRIFTDPILHTDSPITFPHTKRVLYDKTGACAVDMESAAIGQFAREHQIPFLSVRSIVDSSEMVIPSIAIDSTDAYGVTRILPFLGRLLVNPGELSQLIMLGKHFHEACKSLRQITKLASSNLNYHY